MERKILVVYLVVHNREERRSGKAIVKKDGHAIQTATVKVLGKFATHIWDPKLGPNFGPRIWDPNLGTNFGPQIWP